MLATRIRSAGRAHWLAFFAALLACWALLFYMAILPELRALESDFGASITDLLCNTQLGASGWLAAFAMWTLMSAAMMVPTALPAFATYEDIGHTTSTDFGRLVLGYFTAWIGFSALAAALQVALFGAGLISALGQSMSVPLTMGLLIGAGAYQFTPLKEACLSRCRAPLTFFMQHWDEGAYRNGLRLGLDCIGCCWALMLLAFVGGTMNLIFMGLAMVLMTLEKLPQIGAPLTRPVGAILILTGLLLPFF